ncbi:MULTISPECIES: phosphatidate cytidylyltransferase [Paenibacillus]|uniref:phosphatidate cytidylyltransferase n=1 Tax=Paenibacillus TaxID=44249 RepID=UPI00048F7D44|nr:MULTISPECIES: phosphatidate cytidylyltransferase [Paenibacillus]APB76386.1 phosphatidate cytidylyltransferase [Paenibacillus polymyxa]POR29588.1 phosphatidate cytidylyltransferase [Paenibacillus polymyxa]SFQ97167.1 phosphatidate cytidylyltransferase [Paenibacillus sp. cl130]
MRQRLITGILAGIFFLAMVLWGGLAYHLLILAMALIGFNEFARMTQVSPFGGTAILGYVSILAFVFPYEPFGLHSPLPIASMLWLVMIAFMIITVGTKNKIPIQMVAILFLGTVYIGFGFSYIAESRHMEHGLLWTFLLLACIWASDAGAYFVGKMAGKTKLWPAISPNKTVEGSIGGIVLALVIALVFAGLSGGLLPWGKAIGIGLSCAVVGQLGDLVQSAYKRVYGIKDSGNLLPGHGGILDRCDSWIVVFPFVHMLMLLP